MKTQDNTVPEQYTINCPNHRLPHKPYVSITRIAYNLITQNKIISPERVTGTNGMLTSLKNYLKSNNTPFNLRLGKCIVEYDYNKISNFVIFKISNIINKVNNDSYTCYYIMPVGDDNIGITIVLSENEIDHKEYIQNCIQSDRRFSKYKLYDKDLDKIFQLSEKFQLFMGSSSDSNNSAFQVKEYHITESQEYIEYLADQAAKTAKEKVYNERFGTDNKLEITESLQVPDDTISHIPIPHHNYDSDIYEKLMKLLSASNETTMLFLLGYFISHNYNEYISAEYRFSLNLQSKQIKETERLYNILSYLIFEGDEEKPIYFDKSEKFSKRIKKANYMPLILTTSDFNKADKTYLINIIEDYYKSNKDNTDFVIATSKEIISKHIENKLISSVNNSAIFELKTDKSIFESKHEFFEYMHCLIDYNEDIIAEGIDQKKDNLKKQSALSGNEIYRYASVVYLLERYIQYLLDSEYITTEQYANLASKCLKLYSEDIDKSETTTKPDTQINIEGISHTILEALLTAYQDGKFPIEKLSNKPCLYTGCKTQNKLICFPHIENNPLQEVISFLNLHSINLNKDVQEQLKQCWKDNNILHTSGKNGTVYKGKTDTYLAFIPDAIEEFLK